MWTPSEEQELASRLERGESNPDIAKAMHKSVDAIETKKRRLKSVVRVESPDDCTLTYCGEQIRTVADLLAYAKIDLTLWEIVEQNVNCWEVTGKRRVNKEDKLWKSNNHQIKVKLRRRAPAPIQEGIRLLIKDLKPLPKVKTSKPTGMHLLEIGLYDHHFGKLCWENETGTKYDLKMAEESYCRAVDSLITKTKSFGIEKVVLPVGNDFFHVNDWLGRTANGTPVESTDDRFTKVFRVGCRSLQYAIERLLEIAPVTVLYVPGNHDRHTSWFLCEWLIAAFRGHKNVQIDNTPKERKYLVYGCNLLGYTHGDEINHNQFPTLMAVEAADLWAASRFRSWRLGHWHKKKETRYTVGDSFNGVEVRIFPSLSGTDHWHYKKGFIGNPQMAECYLWHKTRGPVGNFQYGVNHDS